MACLFALKAKEQKNLNLKQHQKNTIQVELYLSI